MYGLKIFPCALVWYQMMTRCQNVLDLQCINMFLDVYVVGISCIIVSLRSKTVIICSWWSLDTLNYNCTRCGRVVTVWHDIHTQTCPGVTQWKPARAWISHNPRQCHNNVNLVTPETKLDSVTHWVRNQALS